MKKMIRCIFLSMLITSVIGSAVFAQAAKNKALCLSSEELLDRVCSINSNTLIKDISILAVSVCSIDSTSENGFYFRVGHNNRWCLIISQFRDSLDYFPDGVMYYEDAIKYPPIAKYFNGKATYLKDKYEQGRLIVLSYKYYGRQEELFEIFDLGSKLVLIVK